MTSRYGTLSRYKRFAEPKLRRQMEVILEEIRSGKFAQDWAAEYSGGYPNLQTYIDHLAEWPNTKVENRTLKLFAGQSPPDDEETF